MESTVEIPIGTQRSVLIVAPSSQLRTGLQVLLAAIPCLAVVEPAESDQTALAHIRQQPPTIVLVDFDLPGACPAALLRQIKAGWPKLQCVALVDNRQQQETARSAGANMTLLKGVSAVEILETFERLANRPVY